MSLFVFLRLRKKEGSLKNFIGKSKKRDSTALFDINNHKQREGSPNRAEKMANTNNAVLNLVSKEEMTPSKLVASLAPQDKATIMSLCMPRGANDSDLALYLYRCKQQDFDPLSGELVLRKWNGKDGVSLSFITTRDALLRKAEQNPNYNGMNSGVVKEGDIFEVDTEKSIVIHKFGEKRGKNIAGWAIVYHKTRLPVIAVVDFAEYFNANSSQSPVWQKMPSAMIQKVAEVSALRRQFPILGQGVYTAEELQQQDEQSAQPTPVVVQDQPKAKNTQTNQKEEVVDAEIVQDKPQKAPEPAPVEALTEQQTTEVKETQFQENVAAQEAIPGNVYQLQALRISKSGTGIPFAKIACKEMNKDDQTLVLLAKGEEGVVEAAKLHDNCTFKAEVSEEMGFLFVHKITVL